MVLHREGRRLNETSVFHQRPQQKDPQKRDDDDKNKEKVLLTHVVESRHASRIFNNKKAKNKNSRNFENYNIFHSSFYKELSHTIVKLFRASGTVHF